jgi:hypothetical protein
VASGGVGVATTRGVFVGTGVMEGTGVNSGVGVATGGVAVAAGVVVPAGVAVTPGVTVPAGVPVGPGVFVRTPMGGGVGPPAVTVGPGGKIGVVVMAGLPVPIGVGVGPEPTGPGDGSVKVFRSLHRAEKTVTANAEQTPRIQNLRARRAGVAGMPDEQANSVPPEAFAHTIAGMTSFTRPSRVAAGVFAAAALLAAPLPAQTLTVGVGAGGPFNRSPLNAAGLRTAVQLRPAVNLDGDAVTATFGWSASPCPAAVKIKFFRPQGTVVPFGPSSVTFLEERGPFDVTAPLDPPPSGIAIQTVSLTPPVHLEAGDVIAIANVTSCGAPVYSGSISVIPPPPVPSSISLPGDLRGVIATETGTFGGALFATATGPSSSLGLLGDRFAVSLSATNPRNHATATGRPVRLADGAGYFSLPELTGDANFPEVTVKMTDATASPALGGTFWFFHAPLTDVDYILTVIDQHQHVTRTYASSRAPNGELCGVADTSAFLP